jgi:hypothetical protein
MSGTPMKNQGWTQGLYKVSATKEECLGALRITEDGRKFRYGLAAGSLVPGGACFGEADENNHIAVVQTAVTNAAGLYQVKVLVGATAVVANRYDDGYLVIYDGATGVKGLYYPIASHGVSAAGTEIITLTLKDPLVKATIATDTFSLYESPWGSIVASTDIATGYCGQAMVAMTSGQYGWFQTGGFAVSLWGDNCTYGYPCGPSDTESSLEVASAQVGPVVGYTYYGAGVSGAYVPFMLMLD